MKFVAVLGATVLAGSAFAAAPAYANVCRGDGGLTCATTMPVGGYCECTSRGGVQSGSVVPGGMSRGRLDSTAGGCGAQPNAPGCR